MQRKSEELKNSLIPLYSKLLSDNTFNNICPFCVQWGSNFPTGEKEGILFVGKAVNGWTTVNTDINVLFGDSKDRIFARHDQMIWVHEREGPNPVYNTKKSAFWRVIKKTCLKVYPEKWYSHVAWSNVCKLAPDEGGNPSNALYYEQLETSQKILEKEIEVLSPKYVVMLTSGWEKDFLKYLNGGEKPEFTETIEWNGYVTGICTIKGTKYIVSQHPQGKCESKHVAAISKLMQN